MFKKIFVIFVLAFLVSGFFVKPAEARATPVRVPADVEWVDSGIDVLVGEILTLKAKGIAITGPLSEYPDAKSGPGGQITTCYDYALPGKVCMLDGAPFGALIGKIGLGGSPFLIGGAADFTAGANGWLYLAVNDYIGTYGDNHAGFTVIFK